MNSGEKEKAMSALSSLETELIALKDVMEIMEKIPIEHPRPVYLVRKISEHVKNLDERFREAWTVFSKE